MLILDKGNIMPSTLSEVGWILVYGAVMQCLAWGLIAYSIPKLSLALTGLLLLSEPVAALLIDYTWLDKPINALQWTGALLTMLAIYLGSLKPKPRALRRYRFFARFYNKKY
jgi:drug/metabolite transporter (DMT)-like permease